MFINEKQSSSIHNIQIRPNLKEQNKKNPHNNRPNTKSLFPCDCRVVYIFEKSAKIHHR